jgi:hypothetical protein
MGPRAGLAENLAPTEIRSPDRLARSQLLYRPAHDTVFINPSIVTTFIKEFPAFLESNYSLLFYRI